MSSYGATTRLLANHRRLAEYLQPLFWSDDDEFQPVIYEGFRPYWLPEFFERDELRPPSFVLLTDLLGRVREIYQGGDEPLKGEWRTKLPSQFLDMKEVRTVPVRVEDRPYLLISDSVEDAVGSQWVSCWWWSRSTTRCSPRRSGVSIPRQLLVAWWTRTNSGSSPASTPVSWSRGPRSSTGRTYLVTSHSLPQYEGTDWNLLFATFVPHDSVERMIEECATSSAVSARSQR